MGMTGNVLPLLTYQDIGYSFDVVGNVLGYTNSAAGYETNQQYTYDGLYQLIKAEGDSIGRSGAGTGLYDYETHYEQAFSFDMIGNMTEKKSRTRSPYANPPGVNLDYESQYTYKKGTHQAIQIGSARYEYDGNGNVIIERYGDTGTPTGNKRTHEVHEEDGVYSTDYGFALTLGSAGSANTERRYVWNERNLLKRSSDGQYAVEYRYGADGQRAIKYAVKQGGSGERTETLYYNKWYQLVSTNDNLRMVESKHIYVGETRIATKQRHDDNSNYSEELKHTYYYHGDHLGSAQVVTNGMGEIYEHIEYTLYGELWVDHTKGIGSEEGTPFRFTGKEYDEKTGLYYYGARYLDPKTSRWISTDPAMGEYIPGAPIDDEVKKHNQNLPGMGGVFNYVNLHVYHYAGNNPVKLMDPNGRDNWDYLDQLMDDSMNGEFVDPADMWDAYFEGASRGLDVVLRNSGYIMTPFSIRGGMAGIKFMSKHGSTISLVSYASGNVALGVAVGGIAITCDVTMAALEYKKSGDGEKFASDVMKILITEGATWLTKKMVNTDVAIEEMEYLVGVFTTTEGMAITKLLESVNFQESKQDYSKWTSMHMPGNEIIKYKPLD